MLNTITRRTALAASVSLPLLPVASYALPADPAVEAEADEGSGLDGLLADYERLPPDIQEIAAALVHGLAEYERKRKGVPS